MKKHLNRRSDQYGEQIITSEFDRKGHLLALCFEQAAEQAGKLRAIAAMIDHTLLKPESTEEQFAQLCQEALEYQFGLVCVNSSWVGFCADYLQGSPVKVGATIGFPWGTPSTRSKVAETKAAIRAGAREVDMVINFGKLKSGDYAYVASDIREVVRAAHKRDALVKVIIETCLLSEEEKVNVCLIAKQAGADFVKTSTGFNGTGATAADIALMRAVVGPDMGVKASGGVRSYAGFQKMVAAGATRIGASSGIAIIREAAGELEPSQKDAGSY